MDACLMVLDVAANGSGHYRKLEMQTAVKYDKIVTGLLWIPSCAHAMISNSSSIVP